MDHCNLINVLPTSFYRRWNNVILSALFQRYLVNVETASINVRWINFHFQPNVNIESTFMNVDDQRCFNVYSTLMCFLGNCSPSTSLLTSWSFKRSLVRPLAVTKYTRVFFWKTSNENQMHWKQLNLEEWISY